MADELRGDEPIRSPVRLAYFTDTASSAGDVLMVTVDGFDPDHVFGDPGGVVWAPRVSDGGNAVFPVAGDRAWVCEADDGSWVVVAWTPS